jgi:poly(A) polymerase
MSRIVPGNLGFVFPNRSRKTNPVSLYPFETKPGFFTMQNVGDPLIVARSGHPISRKQIDSDALKVLYRLHQSHYTAYLVGGSVRDLLLGRRPKDFDIGTSAHPYQVKRLFRNCWIIGRRFRLAHVRFGPKTIEVATFRRLVTADELAASSLEEPAAESVAVDPRATERDHFVHRDNTFGTAEEDAFRRDFTINALFYDISSLSIIDYTGGLDDLRAGLIRCIGDPTVRFQEDPVRMLRAVALAARLGFTIDAPCEAAIGALRGDIARSAPARLVDEFYKLLRSGAAERAFRMLAERGLLEPISSALQSHAGDGLWRSLAAVDEYRQRFQEPPEVLTTPILLGSLLVPLGGPTARALSFTPQGEDGAGREPRLALGMLPLGRRDIERLRQILSLQHKLMNTELSPRARRALTHRGPFREAMTWLEIHGRAPEVLEHWRGFMEGVGTDEGAPGESGQTPRRRRRRRGRRRSFRSVT